MIVRGLVVQGAGARNPQQRPKVCRPTHMDPLESTGVAIQTLAGSIDRGLLFSQLTSPPSVHHTAPTGHLPPLATRRSLRRILNEPAARVHRATEQRKPVADPAAVARGRGPGSRWLCRVLVSRRGGEKLVYDVGGMSGGVSVTLIRFGSTRMRARCPRASRFGTARRA
jgi:hypothetical protein